MLHGAVLGDANKKKVRPQKPSRDVLSTSKFPGLYRDFGMANKDVNPSKKYMLTIQRESSH